MASQYQTTPLKPAQNEGKITLSLTENQYAKLLDVLYQYNDGPDGEDCASTELEELRLIVEAASLQDASNA